MTCSALSASCCVLANEMIIDMILHLCMYYYCTTPSRRLRVGARLCVVSRSNIIKIKVPVRFVSRSGDRVKCLKSEKS